MTREEYLEHVRREYGLSAEELARIGVEPRPCWCDGDYPGCLGWQLELRTDAGDVSSRAVALSAPERR